MYKYMYDVQEFSFIYFDKCLFHNPHYFVHVLQQQQQQQ